MYNLASMRFSAPMQALVNMLATLKNGSTHWQLLQLARQAWTAEMRKKVQTVTFRLMAHIWFRLVHFYRHWPWPLSLVLDPCLVVI
jgi:hypothetical protein